VQSVGLPSVETASFNNITRIYWPSVRTWLRVTILASRILRWFLYFWKIPTVVSPILLGGADKIFGSAVSQVSGVTGHGRRRHIFISCFSVFIILDLLACDAVSLG
jgi:hypothetical protein